SAIASKARQKGVHVITGCSVLDIVSPEDPDGGFLLETTTGKLQASRLLIASGSSPQIWEILKKRGHTIQEPLPSLFTFNIKDERLKELAGVAVKSVIAGVKDTKLRETGALLITHWGMSAPAILRLSAWGAKILAEKKYHFTLCINFLPEYSAQAFAEYLMSLKSSIPKKQISSFSPENLPLRLWKKIVEYCKIPESHTWADCSKKQIQLLTDAVIHAEFEVAGKSTFKEEFVTCGGISLKEIDFRTMESKKWKGLFFAGEVMDIDAITGGFNFQAAWTTAWIAAEGMSSEG
ncbi:MAG: aminoacetone oxidase family FAD-binding enzyme, partial [Bacteroidia bacterium]|nr:aminoacetone oxidase family FAD-binding enzyme [Bacteroidia bacterium]